MSEQLNNIRDTQKTSYEQIALVEVVDQPKIDLTEIDEKIDLIKELSPSHFGAEGAAHVNRALDEIQGALHAMQGATAASTPWKTIEPSPFDFEDPIVFSYSNGIFALGNAIYGLLGKQPEIIASEMASADFVSSQIQKWSKAYLTALQAQEAVIATLTGKGDDFQKRLAAAQGQMSVLNAASSASSTGLNGVLSMLTSGTSSKTTTYQNLTQEAGQVVTGLLNAMVQNWI